MENLEHGEPNLPSLMVVRTFDHWFIPTLQGPRAERQPLDPRFSVRLRVVRPLSRRRHIMPRS